MGGLKMPEPPDTAFSGDQGTQCLVLPHPDGGDDPGSCYGNPREHLLRLVSWIYSAIVLTDLKTSLPSAGFFNLMP